MKQIGYITTFLITMLIGSLIQGYTISILWGWFISPLFELKILSIQMAIGMSLFISYTTNHQKIEENKQSFSKQMFSSMSLVSLRSLVVLMIGWCATLFL